MCPNVILFSKPLQDPKAQDTHHWLVIVQETFLTRQPFESI